MAIADEPGERVKQQAEQPKERRQAERETGRPSEQQKKQKNVSEIKAETSGALTPSRWDCVKAALGSPELLDSLRARNDVQLLTVDSQIRELGYFPKTTGRSGKSPSLKTDPQAEDGALDNPGEARDNPGERRDNTDEARDEGIAQPSKAADRLSDLLDSSGARGAQSRLSDSLADWTRSSGLTPISALVLFSDGAQNLGRDPLSAAKSTAAEGIVVHTVGVGQTEAPRNVRIYSVQAPVRVQPEDPFAITALVEGQSVAGETFVVELSAADEKAEQTAVSKPSGQGSGSATGGKWEKSSMVPEPIGPILETRTIRIGKANSEPNRTKTAEGAKTKEGDEEPGSFQTVKFEVPAQAVGKKRYQVRIRPSGKESVLSDNAGTAVVESVDRKLQILLLASGPTREYQFLRSLLSRDKSIEVDILLQSGKPGLSQEGRKVLDGFPSSAAELFEYDGLIAFDPDWNQLTAEQINWIETWVGDKSGGLLFVAGPVYMGAPIRNWLENDSCRKLKNLLPVEFERRFSGVSTRRRTGTEPFPLAFTNEGKEADFLRLDDTISDSQSCWNEFSGVFSYYPVERVKDSATVYACFSDPQTQGRDGQPPFLAEQFYGSGRVFYIGSGEFWRLRAYNPGWFDRLYTQLTRRITQGRLLRQNDRGLFLPRQDKYYLGDTIEFKAQLTDGQGAPLKAPELTATLASSSGIQTVLKLRADSVRPGAYTGFATADREGIQTARLTIPQSDVTLQCAVRVELSDLERRNPQRNEEFLKTWAETTGGRYFDQLETWKTVVMDPAQLSTFFPDRSATTIVQESVDRATDELLMRWFVGLSVAILCLEWLIRRLLKLA